MADGSLMTGEAVLGVKTGISERRFDPYENNGGTCLAVHGKDFCVLASDTRMSTGYSINTRVFSKVVKLTEKAVLASSGMVADITTLHKHLAMKIEQYEHAHRKKPSTPAIARLLSNLLYSRRFMPFYTFNVLGGIDDSGNGCVFSYDAVGSVELSPYSSSGTGSSLIQPLLDNQIGWKGQRETLLKPELSPSQVVDLIRDGLTSAGERDIYTGDFADIFVVTSEGVNERRFPLKLD
ncbi:MAG: proteasome subunit beta [archaeon]|nr:proteasome subunit beta [archaeon]